MKKISIFSIVVLTAILMFSQIPSAEAKSNTRVQVGIGCVSSQPTIVRHYTRPVVAAPVVAAPVFAHPPSYYYYPQRGYYVQAPAYVATPAPVYVEEVYVTPRPIGFSGLSFSWNWFK